jgi:S1-C subfamily serine protease
VFTVEFTGTGFLVDRSGVVLTNRHIAQPWWRNEAAEPLLEDGFLPRFLYLRAYFPGRDHAFACAPERSLVSEEADLATLRLPEHEDLPAPLELAEPHEVVVGRGVLLLGYPSGLNALLARSEEGFVEELTAGGRPGALEILDALAKRQLVRPLPTRGHISDLVGDKVLFDAPTAVGGSGGPLLDLKGRVVAVNYGILKSFRGANFGVPVRFARRLLSKTLSDG